MFVLPTICGRAYHAFLTEINDSEFFCKGFRPAAWRFYSSIEKLDLFGFSRIKTVSENKCKSVSRNRNLRLIVKRGSSFKPSLQVLIFALLVLARVF